MPSPHNKIFAHSPNTLNAAKVPPNQKIIKILTLYLGCNGMVKKPTHATVP